MIDHLLAALHHAPGDDVAWLALADALEEQADPRAELTRLVLWLRRNVKPRGRRTREKRLFELLDGGMRPVVPTLTVSHGIPMTLVPPGVFQMGSPENELHAEPDEWPRHEVEITRAFYLGTMQITQGQFLSLMESNPSTFRPNPQSNYHVPVESTANFPVDGVNFTMANTFCERLSALPAEKEAGRTYRLPTEAEWEYACRAGTQTPFAFGRGLNSTRANMDGQYPYGRVPRTDYLRRTCPVGSYPPNAFGLHDMHGNVWEWTSDRYAADYYAVSPREDPRGPRRTSRSRPVGVLRGGAWIDASWHCRSADRSEREALHYVGMRVAMDVVVRK